MHIQRKIWVALWAASTFVGVGLGVSALAPSFPTQVQAQAIPKSLEQSGPDAELRARKNEWTVGVAGGLLSGSNMTFADEMAQVLDDGDNLRILPIVTYGAASNLDDLLYLRGVDVAITQSDVFEYFRTERKIANLESRINYIVRLPTSEMHVLAGNDIDSALDVGEKEIEPVEGPRYGIAAPSCDATPDPAIARVKWRGITISSRFCLARAAFPGCLYPDKGRSS